MQRVEYSKVNKTVKPIVKVNNNHCPYWKNPCIYK